MQAKRVQPGRVVLVVILIPLLLLLNSCAVLYNGLNQGVPVTTEPVGVEVYLDGEFMGETPLEVQVWRGESHELLLRFGEQERVVLLEPTIQASGGIGLALDVVPAVASFISVRADVNSAPDEDFITPVLGGLVVSMVAVGSLVFVIVDFSTGAVNTLNPSEIHEVFDIVEP